jgi:phospholipase C
MAAEKPTPRSGSYDFVINQMPNDKYSLWRFDVDQPEPLREVRIDPNARFPRDHSIIQVGAYVLHWGPVEMDDYAPSWPYRCFRFDPNQKDPLNPQQPSGDAPASQIAPPALQGAWSKSKFWATRPDFGNPGGARKSFEEGKQLDLLSVGNFVVNTIPTPGRGTFNVFNFDPVPMWPSTDPLQTKANILQSSFDSIESGHNLIGISNFVLDWVPGARSRSHDEPTRYWVWSFDPQAMIPLSKPAVRSGTWDTIDEDHELVAIGDHILDWVPKQRTYRIWKFDPSADDGPLVGPVHSGKLPDGFTARSKLTGVQPRIPAGTVRVNEPGTLDFLRSKIKHVVYLMLENRSFDHTVGWLYENTEAQLNFIGSDRPYDGASKRNYNVDAEGKRVHQTKFLNGRDAGPDDVLDFLPVDPYHDLADVMRQMFSTNRNGYEECATPDMGGFVWNNATDLVMKTYTPNQLPVLNGLAESFAVSDEWFCSIPSSTDANRAFAFTGSSLQQLNNFQNDPTYTNWPNNLHRPSIWKALWNNGITDWKIFYHVQWLNFVHTYHLFLQTEIPFVDASVTGNKGTFVDTYANFLADAKAGKLPAFSFLEPVWIGISGTSSYHPGGDVVPGEQMVNEIYGALSAGSKWDETLFVLTFDEHGGIYDHAAPPRAANPWPNDTIDGFSFDMLGPRVPTILVSPWIQKNTVFRSTTDVAYDHTSILATVLEWQGVPRAQWGLGERVRHAPTFEGVLTQPAARTDVPAFVLPTDKFFPAEGGPVAPQRVTDLHANMAAHAVRVMATPKVGAKAAADLALDVVSSARNLDDLNSRLAQVNAEMNR